MGKPILVQAEHFPEDVEARIERDFTARRVDPNSPARREEVLRAAEGADALFISPVDRLDAEFFQRLGASVKVIATFSVGYDAAGRFAARV